MTLQVNLVFNIGGEFCITPGKGKLFFTDFKISFCIGVINLDQRIICIGKMLK